MGILILKWIGKVVLWVCSWVLLSIAIYYILPVKLPPSHDSFLVCVKDENQVPNIMSFKQAKNFQPCDSGYQDYSSSDYDVKVNELDKNEWEIYLFEGDFTDPIIYHYQVSNNKIEPIWYSHENSLGRNLGAVVLAFGVNLIIFSWRKKLKFKQ